MNRTLIVAFSTALAAALSAGCTENPCDELASYAVGCPDPEVTAIVDRLVAENDKDTCRMYRDAWGYTFYPRCFLMPDGGDSGTTADGSSDAGIDGGYDASFDAQTPQDGAQPSDAAVADAGYDAGIGDAGETDAAPDGGSGDSGGTDASSD